MRHFEQFSNTVRASCISVLSSKSLDNLIYFDSRIPQCFKKSAFKFSDYNSNYEFCCFLLHLLIAMRRLDTWSTSTSVKQLSTSRGKVKYLDCWPFFLIWRLYRRYTHQDSDKTSFLKPGISSTQKCHSTLNEKC